MNYVLDIGNAEKFLTYWSVLMTVMVLFDTDDFATEEGDDNAFDGISSALMHFIGLISRKLSRVTSFHFLSSYCTAFPHKPK